MATLIGVLVLVGIVIVLLVATRPPGRTAARRHSGPEAHWLFWADGDRHDGSGRWFGGAGDFGDGGGSWFGGGGDFAGGGGGGG